MKKWIFLGLFALLLLPNLLAVNLNIEKTSSDEVMILDLDVPTSFTFEVKNNGQSDSFDIYTFFGVIEEPKNEVYIGSGQTKEIEVKILPSYNLKSGYSSFELFFQGSDKSQTSEEILVKVSSSQEAIEIGSGSVDPESNTLEIYVKNKLNYDFGKIDAKFSSVFFDFDETFDLGPNERKTFEVKLNNEDFSKVFAGFYTIKSKMEIYGTEKEIEGTIKFAEKDILNTSEEKYGFIVSTQIISKVNEGNVIQTSETSVDKNIISRIFTSLSPEPDFVERNGAKIHYTWTRDIKPGETFSVKVKTNWLIPFLVIFLFVAIVYLVQNLLKKEISLKKKVSFVKARGGEFALKVSVIVHANKYLEKVNIIDRLPALTKVYERFGQEVPTRVSEEKRRIEWNFEKLEEGEVRVLSYVIYSKVGVVGKFALPSATAIYEREGQIKDSNSNMAFFVAEQRGRESSDEY